MKAILTFSLVVLLPLMINAQHVSRSLAEETASNFYSNRQVLLKDKDLTGKEVNLSYEIKSRNRTLLYVFNVGNDNGFVLVSGYKAVKPVLAYSFAGRFDINNIPPGLSDLIDYYKAQINYAIENNIKANDQIETIWKQINSNDSGELLRDIRNVEPMLLAQWNQTYPYNQMCPEDPAGYAGHVTAGCVATAMCQVMKHWDFPSSGTGTKTYSGFSTGGYGTLSVDFENSKYEWNTMPLSASNMNDELAEIFFHAGVAVSMMYSPVASTASAGSIPSAMENYFKYDPDCMRVRKQDWGDEQYKQLLKNQLDSKIPLIYTGENGSGAGHAWNCDGYMGDEFHMNWGWSGAGNGYYSLDSLISSGTAGGSQYNFSFDQEVIIGLYPDGIYPFYCSDTDTIKSPEGSFGDGSADKTYNFNQECFYLIDPECGELVNINFERFDLGSGDVINIFNGTSVNDELLDSFDSVNPPGTQTITGNRGGVLIQFLTDGSSNADGWYVSFNSDYCYTDMNFTDESGYVSDGSGDCNYSPSTVCSWYLEPDNADQVQIDFSLFDLAGMIDNLKIYKGSNMGELVADLDSSSNPSQIIVDSSVVFVQFYSDSDSDTGEGWAFEYQAVNSVENIEMINACKIFPNPTEGEAFMEIQMNKSADLNIILTDITGRKLSEKALRLSSGHHVVSLSELIKTGKSGLFFIQIESGQYRNTKKLIIK